MKPLMFMFDGLKRTFIASLVATGIGGCSGWVVEQSSSVSFSTEQGDPASDPPPPLPDYDQPECPEPGDLWVPGYWARSDTSYYWVPGTWVEPPQTEVLWTPGYWDETDRGYVFHEGYWSRHVGFYGGIYYGNGYSGSGYDGGRWEHGRFSYNRAVNNIDTTVVHNTYTTTVITHTDNRSGYNGGGRRSQPSAQDQIALAEPHLRPTNVQATHQASASTTRALYATENHGAPPVAATTRPGTFRDRNAVPARSAGSDPRQSPESRQERDLARYPRSPSSREDGNVEAQPSHNAIRGSSAQAPQNAVPLAKGGGRPDTYAPPQPSPERPQPVKSAAPEHQDKDHPHSSN